MPMSAQCNYNGQSFFTVGWIRLQIANRIDKLRAEQEDAQRKYGAAVFAGGGHYSRALFARTEHGADGAYTRLVELKGELLRCEQTLETLNEIFGEEK